MGSTFLSLTNQVLAQLNETPLNEDNFNTSRGIHTTTRNTVSMAVQKINSVYHQWPWNAAQQTQDLLEGVSEYAWPENFSNVDWNSFSIRVEQDINFDYRSLHKVNRNEWYPHYKGLDDNLRPGGRGIPSRVFESHGYGFGVTPSPNKNYQITYRYYKTAPLLAKWDDTTDIPSAFDYVIVMCALYMMKSFKNDAEGTSFIETQYRSGLSELRANFAQKYDEVRDTRVRRARFR